MNCPCVQIIARSGKKRNSGNPDDYTLIPHVVVVSPSWWRKPWTQKETSISLDTRKHWLANEKVLIDALPDPALIKGDTALTRVRNAIRTRSVPTCVYGARSNSSSL